MWQRRDLTLREGEVWAWRRVAEGGSKQNIDLQRPLLRESTVEDRKLECASIIY